MKAIVIGAGPAIKKYGQLEQIRKSKFTGKIITTDKMFRDCLEIGITPDKFDLVVVSSEYGNDIHKHYFKEIIDKKARGCTAYIYTPDNKVTEYLKSVGCNVITWPHNSMDEDANNLTNVGAISWMTAWKYLKCNKIALIGMNQSYDIQWLENFPKEYQGKLLKIRHSDAFKSDYVLDPLYDYYSKSLLDYLEMKKDTIETWNCTGEGSIDKNCIIDSLENFIDSKN